MRDTELRNVIKIIDFEGRYLIILDNFENLKIYAYFIHGNYFLKKDCEINILSLLCFD